MKRFNAKARMGLILSLSIMSAALLFNNCSSIAEPEVSSLASSNCAAAPANLRDPRNIQGVVDLINALPKPVTMECFLSNLSAPLSVFSAESTFSAQPSAGKDNPRIFIIRGQFLMSVVPDGEAKNTLEMSEYISAEESVKGEILFPVLETMSSAYPFDHLVPNPGAGTACRFCHINERRVSGYGGDAFASPIMRPNPFGLISSSKLRGLAQNCNTILQFERCAVLRAIFIKGQAHDTGFP
jgi:hypothetical protein